MTVTLSAPGTGESFSAAGCQFRVLSDGSETNNRIGVVECELAPGWGGPPQHVHREHDETFFVVSGTVLFTSGAESLLAPSGSLVTAPIGDPHTFANADSSAPATLLCTVTPERYINYFRKLADLRPGPDGRMDAAQILAIMSQYATEPYRG